VSFAALDSALLGPLFATEAMRAVFDDAARLNAMLQAEAALAEALATAGLAPAGLAAAIAALDATKLDVPALGEATAQAGVPVIPFVAAVRKRLPADLEPAFHFGATTQDIGDTALVLQMRAAMRLVLADSLAVLDGLAALAQRHRQTLCVARSYGQHAAPITFGHRVAVWGLGLADVLDGWPALCPRVLVASLGGPVGTLAAYGDKGPTVLEDYARGLDLSSSPLAWHVRRGGMVGMASWLGALLAALGKMAGDIVYLGSTDVGEVAEPHQPGRGGSSAMPHKRNPVGATVIAAATLAAPGLVATMLHAAGQAEGERPAGAWHAEWHALPMLFGLASGALREAKAIAAGLTMDEARMMENLGRTRGLVFADAAAARLAAGMGAAAAHALIERAADTVRRTGKSLQDVLATEPGVDAAALKAAFDLTPARDAAALSADRGVVSIRAVRDRLATMKEI